jgi:replicative DNA helicase
MERPKFWRLEHSEALESNLVVHGDDHISVNDIGRIVDSMQDDYGKQVDLVCFDYLGVLTESGGGQAVTAGVLSL